MINIQIGKIILYKGVEYIIENIIPPDNLIIKSAKNEIKSIKIAEIDDENSMLSDIPKDFEQIDDKLYSVAKERYEVIKPILEGAIVSKKDKLDLAKSNNIHLATLYDWLSKFKTTNTLLSLIPKYKKRGGKGKSKLPKDIEITIDTFINERYLSRQKISIAKLHREINANLKYRGYRQVSYNTLRNRINQLDERKVFRIREGKSAYNNSLRESKKSYEVQYPLQVIQIDHTPLDIEIVDETYRKPIGRPYITVAIDIFSRMVYGLYLSLDAPSFYSVGQTIYLGFTPKDKYLKDLGIDSKWEIYGVPNTIHLDNAAEFRGEQLKRVCEIFNINIDFRPRATPYYGGHIERFIRTLNQEIHSLMGTTFSNPQERKEYDSSKKAVFTLKELERYIVKWVTDYYHNAPHEGLQNKTPKEKFLEGILGSETSSPAPLRVLTTQELEIAKISLLPYEERTIQRTGVSLHGITYYDEALIPFMTPAPQNKQKEKYIFRYDPKNLSKIYFYHPIAQEYIEIPYKHSHLFSISLWELRRAREYIKAKSIGYYNELTLFETIQELRKMEEESADKTKLHRRRKENKKVSKPLSSKFKENNSSKTEENKKFEPKIKKFDIDFKDN